MADDELDSLYWAQPDASTAQRTTLVAAARQRGDEEAAERISAARKPTTAAWIINRLALRHKDAKKRLADLGDGLRAAHASMDGDRIRDLSAEQHKLISELTRAALEAAEVSTPSSTVRDDLTSTLQAAIADPEVAHRLGRLCRPEQWSGFGAFADAAPAKTARTGKSKEPSHDKAAHQQRETLSAAIAAERDKAEADGALSQRKAERDAARQRRDEALATLRSAERELQGAEGRYDKAVQASLAAAKLVKEAKAQLKRG